MSSPFAQSPNPYAASVIPPPATAVMPLGPQQSSMDYMRAYQYVFENPNWLSTVLLLGLVCVAAMIPGVGILLQLLFVGYQFETIDWLLRTQGRQYQAFDFGRIGDYFGRGLWPFLVSLVGSFVLVAVFYVGIAIVAVIGAGVGSTMNEDAGAAAAGILAIIGIPIMIIGMIVAAFYLTAMSIRSGLAQEFAAGFQVAWLQDFVRKMWLDMLIGFLFLGVTALALELLGLMALCVGILFVIPVILLAHAHLLYQFYVVYLSRGGMPVPMKSSIYAAPQPPMAMPPGYPPKPPA
jgi:hypothetical protein